MFDRQGMNFNMSWSMKRIQKEHDRVQEIITKESLEYLGEESFIEFKPVKNIKDKDLPDGCEILRHEYALAREGLEMGHCVASYAEECKSGESIIIKCNEPRATIEFCPKTLDIIQIQGMRSRKAPKGIQPIVNNVKSSLSKITEEMTAQ